MGDRSYERRSAMVDKLIMGILLSASLAFIGAALFVAAHFVLKFW